MLEFKRLVGLSGLTGLLAAAAFAAPAHANLKGDCVVEGEAKVVDKMGLPGGVQLVGSEGKLYFRSLSLLCLADSNKDGIVEVTGGEVIATGWYDNTVCGTGKALGTITSVRATLPKYQLLLGQEFAVQFYNFKGLFKWRNWSKPQFPTPKTESDDTPGKDDNTAGYTPAGNVELGPALEKPLGVPPLGACGQAFGVTGNVVIDFDR